MSVQIFKLTKIIKGILVIIVCPLGVLAQANTPPIGTSTNLCPGQTYRYTSGAANDGGLCNRFGGWIVENGKITSDGVGSNNSVWADVQWDNASSGKVGNFCGVLTVAINSISQPTMSGSSTVSLCGSGSITLQATVSSTTNITGYVWNIVGTGVSPTGLVNTTSPQLTINYNNWTAGSSLSATVAVGTKNSCGFTTRVTPLVAIDPIPGIPGSGVSAIPRSAWVQLSPGNIDNLLVQYNFSPLAICANETMVITNQPANTNISWSSGNTSALSINPSTGATTRLNNFTGSVEVFATVSNACGSNTKSTNVWLGSPSNPVTNPTGNNIITMAPAQVLNVNATPQVANTFSWSYTKTAGSYSNGLSLYPYGPFNQSCSVEANRIGDYTVFVSATNACGSTAPQGRILIRVRSTGGGGQMRLATAYPNPSNDHLTVAVKEVESDEEVFVTMTNKSSEKVYSSQTKDTEIIIPTQHLPEGTYYLHIQSNKGLVQKQIIVNH